MRSETRLLRKNVFDFITNKIFISDIKSTVLEIGPMQKQWTPIKKYFVDTKSHFISTNIEYISCDIDPTSGCDFITDVLNLENVFEKNKFNAIIALELIEHVSKIWELPQIFSNLLNDNGILFLSTPYYFYRHSPFPDYWRLSEDAIKFLFEPYFDVQIFPLVIKDERKPIHYTIICKKK